MDFPRQYRNIVLGLLLLISTSTPAQAIVLDPSVSLMLIPAMVETVSPTFGERVVVPPSTNNKRTIAAMFDSNIQFVGNPQDAVIVTNLNTGNPIPLDDIRIHKNMLYIYSTSFEHNSTEGIRYLASLIGSQIRRAGGTTMADGGLGWEFTLADGIDSTVRENIPKVSIEKTLFSNSNIQFTNTENREAIYRITVSNQSDDYALNNIEVRDVLPSGFSFDGLVFGSDVSVSGLRVLTFTIGTALAPNSSKVFDFRATIASSVSDGIHHNSAMVTADFVPAGINSDRYNVPTISSFDYSDETDEDVLISHATASPAPTATSPTPSPTPTTSSPTPTTTPSSTTVRLAHPSTDPLTCLQLNGAAATNFSDVPSSLQEAPYISFINTTVFASTPSIRLSRGYTNNTFGTNNTLTRFELTKMALGANCINYTTSPVPNSYFTDVPTDNSEMSLVIGKAKALGIVQGIGNQFFPDRHVSYGEMVKILVGSGVYFSRGVPSSTLPHTLNGISDESFRQFAEHAVIMNLVNLSNGNTFPQNTAVQRRFMAQAVARYIAWLKNISIL